MGVDEHGGGADGQVLLVRSQCDGCGLRVGVETTPEQAVAFLDGLVWTDDARHVLDRMPPYLEPLVREQVEQFARVREKRVVTLALLSEARRGETVTWSPEAEQRLENVPAPVRALARIELERTALEKGRTQVTVAIMEEVKARYFGLAAPKRDE